MLALLFSRIDAARLWVVVRGASAGWLCVAIGIYAFNLALGMWRWRRLFVVQAVDLPFRTVAASVLVASFLNNFLPGTLGRDVVRIRDTAGAAGSAVLAATVVFADRLIGLLALVLVSCVGATSAHRLSGVDPPVWPSPLWAGFGVTAAISTWAVLMPAGVGRLLRPLAVVHPEWFGKRIDSVLAALSTFGKRRAAIAGCFVIAVVEQAAIVGFYFGVAHALHVRVSPWHMAVIVPLATLVQMIPISINGLGLREATFSIYFSRVGLPVEAGLLTSLVAQALVIVVSISGAAVWLNRGRP